MLFFTFHLKPHSLCKTGYTICLPFAWTLKLDENSEAKVYAPTKIEDVEGVTTVTFSEVEGGQMAAFTPYYIVVSTGGATIKGQGGSVEQHQTAGSAVIDDASYQFKGSTVNRHHRQRHALRRQQSRLHPAERRLMAQGAAEPAIGLRRSLPRLLPGHRW